MQKKEKMTRDTIPQNFTLGLAVYDAVPVVLFGMSVVLLGIALGSGLFLAGGLLSLWAGLAKVIWKILVVTKKKNVWWLFLQMRICMPIGFLAMITAAVLCRGQKNAAELWYYARTFPVSALLLAGAAGLVLMGVCAAFLSSADVRTNWIEQTINTIAQLSIFLAAVLLVMSAGAYTADAAADKALQSDDAVSVAVSAHEVVFTPNDTQSDTGVIFYPGGKVAFTAYAPLAKEIAEQGFPCVLVEMPLNYAFMDASAAEDVMAAHPEISSWYLAGHSLGGAFGSIYAAGHTDRLSGVILLAAYSTKSLAGLPVLTIYGTEDGVMNSEKYEKYRSNLPSDCTELVIEGGNHAMFGSYGSQEGDGTGLITPQEQQVITAEAIAAFIRAAA